MKSPIYWNPFIYHFIIRKLYGKDFEIRYQALADLIPEKSEIVELCMGDGYLYEHYLKNKNVKYLGLDLNNSFIREARKKNITCQLHNLLWDKVPCADIILLQGSLYQFIPHEKNIIRKMLNACRKMVLISEPVINRAQSPNFLIKLIAQYGVNPGTHHAIKRFSEQSLLKCFTVFPEFKTKIMTGKEMIGIFEK